MFFRCSHLPVEGVVKLLSCLCVVIVAVFQSSDTDDSRHNQAIGQLTVFCLFACSALLEIFTQCCRCFSFPGLDYLVLVVCFNLQSVMLAYHTDLTYSWFSVADTCAMYAATFAAVALLLEYKYPNYVWFALMRAFTTLVLGTWCFHIFVVQWNITSAENDDSSSMGMVKSNMSEQVKIEALKENTEPAYLENLALVPMYFSWHFLFNMNLMTLIWVIVMKLASKKCGICRPPDNDEEVTHFENRVHFDYHRIARMTDSDYEQE